MLTQSVWQASTAGIAERDNRSNTVDYNSFTRFEQVCIDLHTHTERETESEKMKQSILNAKPDNVIT